MVREKIPYKLVKRVVKNYVSCELSSESTLYLQDYVTNMLNEISVLISEEFESYNFHRKSVKLQRIKRINIFILKRAIKKFIRSNFDTRLGNIGQNNRETIFSKAGAEVV